MTPKFVNFILGNHFKKLKWPDDFKQIYKATRDGDDGYSFWGIMEGIGNAFIFAKSTQGRSFGGFRKVAFQNAQKKWYIDRLDDEAYLF